MSYADRVLVHSALQGLAPVPAQLQFVDDVDQATLDAELEQLGALPN